MHRSELAERTRLLLLSLALFYPFGSLCLAQHDSLTGMPAAMNPANVYQQAGIDQLIPSVRNHLPRVYVPNRADNTVSVIDPIAMIEVDRFTVGLSPQHVVPAWDMSVLWVNNNGKRRKHGGLTPIDPLTAKPMPSVFVVDPYNMYFSPNSGAVTKIAVGPEPHGLTVWPQPGRYSLGHTGITR